MITKYAPKPTFSAAAALERLEAARTEYLEKREALEKEHRELQELRSILKGHRKQAQAAQQQAEEAIRAARGHETEETISLQEMAIRKERQIQVVESMVSAQEPAVELLQIDAYGARIGYLGRLSHARASAGRESLTEAAEALFSSKEATPFLKALPQLLREAEESVYRNPIRMASHSVDLAAFGGQPTPEAIKPYINNESQAEIDRDVELHQLAAIGEMVKRFIPDDLDDPLSEGEEILQPIEPMSCEASASKWGNSSMMVANRRRELIAQMEGRAA